MPFINGEADGYFTCLPFRLPCLLVPMPAEAGAVARSNPSLVCLIKQNLENRMSSNYCPAHGKICGGHHHLPHPPHPRHLPPYPYQRKMSGGEIALKAVFFIGLIALATTCGGPAGGATAAGASAKLFQ